LTTSTRGRGAAVLAASIVVCAAAARVAAIGGSVTELRTVDGHVRAALAVRDAFNSAMRQVLEAGEALHLRIEAALWEDRTVWDRAVEPPRVTIFRIVRSPSGTEISVIDPGGGTATYRAYPDPLVVDVDLGDAAKVRVDAEYYVSAAVTLGTLSEQAAEEANEAVFGRDDGSPGLTQVGRFLLNTVLQLSDYVRSESIEIRGARVSGARLRLP
jgi:hypothetical protein